MLPAGKCLLVNILIILRNMSRFASTSSHVRHKPGRQVVTFLLVCNLAMWMVNILEMNKANSSNREVRNIICIFSAEK